MPTARESTRSSRESFCPSFNGGRLLQGTVLGEKHEVPNDCAGRALFPLRTVACLSCLLIWSSMVQSSSDRTPIQLGLLTHEPIRLAGMASIFEQESSKAAPPLTLLNGSLEDLLAIPTMEYLVVDLNSFKNGLETLQTIRRKRPSLRLIVIGPDGDDELVLSSIMAGARAFLDLSASPETVRMAIDVVTSGSIWAPRRLLSRLIDRLLNVPDPGETVPQLNLTIREREVLGLILTAAPNREIARKLGIEERTVKAHMGRLMRKTGTTNRVELSLRAISMNLVPAPNRIGAPQRTNSQPPERSNSR